MRKIDLDALDDVLSDYIIVPEAFAADQDEEWQKLYPVFAAARAYSDLMSSNKWAVVPRDPNNKQLANGVGEYNFWHDWEVNKDNSAVMLNRAYKQMVKAAPEWDGE